MSPLAAADGVTFWGQFLPNLLATLIGAFVGFLLALRVDHARERGGRERQEAALVRAARDGVKKNLELLSQLQPILAAGGTIAPTFEMDVVILDVVVPRLSEILVDSALLNSLNDFRYQLHHVNRQLDHFLTIGQLNTFSPGHLGPIVATVSATVGPLAHSGETALLPLLDGRIKKLEGTRRPWWKLWGA